MKITPLDIRQKTFEKNLRGFDKDEVTAFLVSLSQEWERIMDELKEARIRLETSEREVSKLREVETTLFKTLKTAEDTGASLIEQASKTAELHLKESQIQADGILFEAKTKARALLEEAESRSQEILQELDSRLKELVQEYRSMQSHRDHLASDLSRMAGELSARAERLKKVNEGFNPDQVLNQPKRESGAAAQTPDQEMLVQEQVKPAAVQPPDPGANPEKKQGSFFDSIS